MKRSTGIKRYTPLKRTALIRGNRKPIPKVSSKRKVDNRIYSAKRKRFLEERPFCARCVEEALENVEVAVALSTDVHHVKGRLGGNFLDESTWMPVCRRHHDWIHAHPSQARAKGWLE